jgi:hypothetical protein
MGFRYGEHLYGEHRYSYLADWWHDRTCEEGVWKAAACAETAWGAIDTAPPYNPWVPVGEVTPPPKPPPPSSPMPMPVLK